MSIRQTTFLIAPLAIALLACGSSASVEPETPETEPVLVPASRVEPVKQETKVKKTKRLPDGTVIETETEYDTEVDEYEYDYDD